MTGPPTTLPAVSHTVTREQVERYADASGDHNPIHVDEAFAAGTRFGRPIAHGMLVLAFVSEMLTKALKRSWLTGGRLRVRFRIPVYHGDRVYVTGLLREVAGSTATYDVVVRNQDGADVITGEASVPWDDLGDDLDPGANREDGPGGRESA